MRYAHDGPNDFLTSLLGKIQARTHGQVRELGIEIDEETVFLSGKARTHYAKQLAHHGALDLINGQTLVNRIVVG